MYTGVDLAHPSWPNIPLLGSRFAFVEKFVATNTLPRKVITKTLTWIGFDSSTPCYRARRKRRETKTVLSLQDVKKFLVLDKRSVLSLRIGNHYRDYEGLNTSCFY